MERNSSIDFLKIVSMFMVVILHVLNQGGAIESAPKMGINYLVFYVLFTISFVSVNLFAMITGYLMIKSKWKLSNYINLYFLVFFYSVIITFLAALFLKEPTSLVTIFNSIFPVSRKVFWYFSAYTGLFLLIPFINAGINNSDKKKLQFMILVIFLIGALSTIFKGDPFNLEYGYSALWLILMYVIGSYIRLYVDISALKIKKHILVYGMSNLFIFIFICITSLLFSNFSIINWFLKYTSPFILLNSIIVFLLFLKLDIKNNKINKTIIFLSQFSFSVYIIHTHPVVYELLLKNLVKSVGDKNPIYALFAVLSVSILIYLACTIVDFLRKKLFDVLKVNNISKNIDIKIMNILTNIISKKKTG